MLLFAILRRYPSPHGVVLDLPPVIEDTQLAISADGLSALSGGSSLIAMMQPAHWR